jgi:hypothetical protein
MIMDKELLFADGTWAPTTGANVSPNVLDVGPLGTPVGIGSSANLGRDLGQGEPMWWIVQVITTVTSAGAATVAFVLRSAANAALTTTPIDLVSTPAIAKATLVAGYAFKVRLPSAPVGVTGWQRYVGVVATVGTADLTAGKFESMLVKDEQANTIYGSAFVLDV